MKGDTEDRIDRDDGTDSQTDRQTDRHWCLFEVVICDGDV